MVMNLYIYMIFVHVEVVTCAKESTATKTDGFNSWVCYTSDESTTAEALWQEPGVLIPLYRSAT